MNEYILTVRSELLGVFASAERAIEWACGHTERNYDDVALWCGSELLAVVQTGAAIRILNTPTYTAAVGQGAASEPLVDLEWLSKPHPPPAGY